LTNNHVVADADTIIVTLQSGDNFFAFRVGGDRRTDTAVLKITSDASENLTPAVFGDSASLAVGQQVYAIGHALNLPGEPIITDGIVSALGVNLDIDPQTVLVDMVLHTAPINPGNSGGPLVNQFGQIIGLNTAIADETRGLGFAIDMAGALTVARQLVDTGFVERGYLGITPLNVSPELIAQLGLSLPPRVQRGVLVTATTIGAPAEQSGVEPGDILFQINDILLDNTGELSKFLLAHPPGELVNVALYRNGEAQTLPVELGDQPPES